MGKKTDIHAVELVRLIRDQQSELLQGKSNDEIIEFFRKAGEAENGLCQSLLDQGRAKSVHRGPQSMAFIARVPRDTGGE
ncbi:MAG: hypothetical protein Q7O66_18590 [Dehalococcoidia bacterium]|nr:hypothetical protein [Dehalococcoidia bacterium]